MKEAIERVIAELNCITEQINPQYSPSYLVGRHDACVSVINRLRQVIEEHGTHDRSRVSGNGGEEAKQIPSETDSS